MLVIQDTIISPDVLEEYFQCDLSVCKGICCREGEAGAPVEKDEAARLEEILPLVWNDLPVQSREVIKKQGVVYTDDDGDCVTSIVNGEECVFAYCDENGCYKCAIEKISREGKTDFNKPASCYLYPVRVVQYKDFRAVNYHRWSVCEAAREMGKANGMKVYRFLQAPLIWKFGEEWYEELEKNASVS
ncbi:MAG: DUF3109 family protein [Dysgonamonadaceae bacterium]|jgi:hypothetical protein|nr:DUF3109 family protein [Dysgonamonadaceae bacterium]